MKNTSLNPQTNKRNLKNALKNGQTVISQLEYE